MDRNHNHPADDLYVTTPGGSYEVIVAHGALDQLPERLHRLGLRGAAWIISDDQVFPHYAPALIERLRAVGCNARGFAVPAGEPSKDLAMVARLYDWLIGNGVERRDVVLALGGGVVGDLAGFVAATVLRGIALVHLPTTLLAMVDSAIGGKTGVNHPLGKNLIGAFHQPRLVLADTATLTTLPPRELRAGWAEVIKHAVIRDAALFTHLEAITDPASLRGESLAAVIRRAARVKIEIVNIDERETGERMLLNYGHTLGHAIEAACGYGDLLHGEAVAIGMHLEAQIAARMGMVEPAFVERQERLLRTYGLPTDLPPGTTVSDLLERTLRDKKVRAGRVRWALPQGIGAATVRDDVPETVVRGVLEGAQRCCT
ncbi:MAG: 3-dehydroquinate synthase [Roseiflexus sp.]|nr:3-dehydroquinate synthase [Roseiflexus sp.]